jgi:molybdopterin-guanine dinucleotide biosynthesis protein A
VATLLSACEEAGADLACARSRGRAHPVFGLWRLELRDDLRRAMVEEEVRKVDRWTTRHRLIEVDFPDLMTTAGPLDPFFNTNRPEDLADAERYLELAN